MNADQSEIKNQKSAILWLIIPSLVLIAVLAFDLLPLLRGNDEWRWPLRRLNSTARLLVPIVTLGLYVFLCALWLKRFERGSGRRAATSAGSCCSSRWPRRCCNSSLAFAVSRLPLLEFFGPTVSVHNSGYFTTAVTSPDLNQLLANFPALDAAAAHPRAVASARRGDRALAGVASLARRAAAGRFYRHAAADVAVSQSRPHGAG